MHIHVAVSDLEQSIAFYSKLFDTQPSVVESDYAKWMLEDPRVNFAISARGISPGLDHLGMQVDSGDELQAIHDRLDAAGQTLVSQEATTCCYARSDKHWVTDPQGLAWETFHTLESAPVFGAGRETTATDKSCCASPAVPSPTARACCDAD
jgi:catechol 2,3-dioxygenase-like lactoylglutathione lyase family enzyme